MHRAPKLSFDCAQDDRNGVAGKSGGTGRFGLDTPLSETSRLRRSGAAEMTE